MRERLAKYIGKKFGASYGSAELKELRQELIANALDRYDEEIRNGASEDQAYRTAAESVGNMGELLASMNVTAKRRARGMAVIIPIFSVLAVLFLILTYYTRQEPVIAVLFAGCGLFGLGLIAFGVISLLSGTKRKAGRIVSIAIGGSMVFTALYMALFVLIGILSDRTVCTYDYSEKSDLISSVEAVVVTKTAEYEDELEYSVIKRFGPEEWEPLIKRIAQIEYVFPYEPPTWQDGETMLLIRFEPSDNGTTLALIGECCPCLGERAGTRVKIISSRYRVKTPSDWDGLQSDFGF